MATHTRPTRTSPQRLRPVALIALIGLFLSAMTACGKGGIRFGSGELVSRDFEVEDFDKIEIDGAWEAAISIGDTHSVVVQTDDNLLEFVDVKSDGGTLHIGLDVSALRSTTAVSIVVPEISSLEVNGASAVVIEDLDEDTLEAEFGGASTVIMTGSVDKLKLDANGSVSVDATGVSDAVEIDVNGASSVDMSGWITRSAEIDVNGASDLALTGADSVSGSINGASDLVVNQTAQLDVTTSGASDVHRR